MKNYVTIAGREFEVGSEMSFTNHVNSNQYHLPNFYKAYAKPSFAKVRIYEDWFTWFDTNKRAEDWQYTETIGVYSHNVYVFTLGITMFDGCNWWYLVIYPTRKIAHRLYGTH